MTAVLVYNLYGIVVYRNNHASASLASAMNGTTLYIPYLGMDSCNSEDMSECCVCCLKVYM